MEIAHQVLLLQEDPKTRGTDDHPSHLLPDLPLLSEDGPSWWSVPGSSAHSVSQVLGMEVGGW